MKLLLYCTKSKPYLIIDEGFRQGKYYEEYATLFNYSKKDAIEIFGEDNLYNGKIVGECDYEVEEIKNKLTNDNSHLELSTDKLTEKELFEKSCLNRYEMFNYLQNNFTKKGEPNGYAIHIKNLKVFDEPSELSNYLSYITKNEFPELDKPIKKAPQNMMYCYLDDDGEYYDDENEAILISIQPQWLCKILNGEKIIEVRKKVLKGMLENGNEH